LAWSAPTRLRTAPLSQSSVWAQAKALGFEKCPNTCLYARHRPSLRLYVSTTDSLPTTTFWPLAWAMRLMWLTPATDNDAAAAAADDDDDDDAARTQRCCALSAAARHSSTSNGHP